MTERRAVPRYDLSLRTIVHPSPSSGLPLEKRGLVRNVSSRGVYLFLDDVIVRNGDLNLSMLLPVGEKGDVTIHIRGQITRIEEGGLKVGVAAVIHRYQILRDKEHS